MPFTMMAQDLKLDNPQIAEINFSQEINWKTEVQPKTNHTNEDKIIHFFAGAGVSVASYFLFTTIHKQPKNEFEMKRYKVKAKFFAVAVGVLVGVLKELYDQNKGGEFDYLDLGATGLGAVSVTFTF